MMNKRIVELAVHANSHHGNFFDLNYKELDVFLEKFAELIIKECLSKVDASHPLEERSEWRQNSFAEETIKCKIKQHFGVEE